MRNGLHGQRWRTLLHVLDGAAHVAELVALYRLAELDHGVLLRAGRVVDRDVDHHAVPAE